MGRDHELTFALGRCFLEQRDQRQLALRRQRSLGLVQQVQPPRHQPRLQQLQELLAVRAAVHVIALTSAQLRGARLVRCGDPVELTGR